LGAALYGKSFLKAASTPASLEQDNDMERKPKRQKRLIIILVISVLISACLCISFILVPFGFVDFPCFVSVEDGVLVNKGYGLDEFDETADAFVFITTSHAHFSGAGCLSRTLKDGEDLTVGEYHLTIDRDLVLVDPDVQLAVGESISLEDRRFGFNPWWYYVDFLQLKNEGYVQAQIDYDDNRMEFEKPVLVLIGAAGDREKLNPVTAVIFGLALLSSLFIGSYLVFHWIVRLFHRISQKKD
jgi:hypothetical protein